MQIFQWRNLSVEAYQTINTGDSELTILDSPSGYSALVGPSRGQEASCHIQMGERGELGRMEDPPSNRGPSKSRMGGAQKASLR